MIGKKIKDYLDSKGISQTFLASKIDMSIPMLNRKLNGTQKLSADELGKIAKVLKVSADIFLN